MASQNKEVLEITVDELSDIVNERYDENADLELISMEETAQSTWGDTYEGVLKRLSDGKFFKGTWAATDGGGCNIDLEGEQPFVEVVPVTKMVEITTYE